MSQNEQSDRADEIARLMRARVPDLMPYIELNTREAAAQGLALYLVGGFVRDLLLGASQPTKLQRADLDFVLVGSGIQFAQAMRKRYGGVVSSHTTFGTATLTLRQDAFAPEFQGHIEGHIDYVTARSESYPQPGALPVVKPSTMDDDLHRRDFTINAIAIRLYPEPFGTLIDPFSGEHDLAAGVIRVLHDGSFRDDATRIFRAARFEQRFGFHIVPETLALIPGGLLTLPAISGERLRNEIDLILHEREPENALLRLDRLGALIAMYGELAFDEWLQHAFSTARSSRNQDGWHLTDAELLLVYWILLTWRVSDFHALVDRLMVLPDERAAIIHGKQIAEVLPSQEVAVKPSTIRRLLGDATDIALYAAWIVAPSELARENIANYAHLWRDRRRIITGDDLKAMGLKPGPRFGRLLDELQRAWDDGDVSTPEQERAFLNHMLAEGFGL